MFVRIDRLERGMQPVGSMFDGYTFDRSFVGGTSGKVICEFIEDDQETSFTIERYPNDLIEIRE